LLAAFERLPQDARSSLVNFMRALTSPEGVSRARTREIA
jgi:hypothetical protein